jgi:hypothetical protein
MKQTRPDTPFEINDKPTAYNSSFPFHLLDHRTFELLMYSLGKNEIMHGDFQGIFDDIWLMEGVREKGRDCSLYLDGQLTGLIQCKHRSTITRVGKVEVVKEVVKFLLHMINDEKDLSNPFDYYFAVSSDFDTAARELLENFNEQVIKEKDLEKWIRSVIKENKSFQLIQFDEIKKELMDYLEQIKLHHLASTDLTLLLNRPYNAAVISTFFTVRVVVEEATVLQQNLRIQESLNSIHQQTAQPQVPVQKLLDQLDNSSIFLAHYTNQFSNVPDSHLVRKETTELFNWIVAPLLSNKDDETIILLTGNAGCGKSVILRDLFEKLKSENIPALGIKADRFPVSSIKELEEKLFLPDNLITQFERLSSQFEKIVILIDQIDALSQTLSSQRDALNTYQLLVNALKRIPNIRIVISVRTYDLNYDPDLQFYKKQRSVKVSNLSEGELNSVLQKLGLEPRNITSSLQSLLANPNHLNVFCKIYKPSLTIGSIKTMQDLYEELWEQILSSIPQGLSITRNSVKSFLQNVAQAMNEQQQITLATATLKREYGRELEYLTSQGILLSDSETFQFFHQTFYDFVFARSFVESGRSVLSYIKTNHNSLFIRSSLKMILGFLSQTNHDEFIRSIRKIIQSQNYLFHIKLLVYNLIGFVENPSEKEYQVIRKNILPYKGRRTLFLESVFSEKLLMFLIQEGTLDDLLGQKNVTWQERLHASSLLQKIIPNRALKIIDYYFPNRKVNTEELCFSLLVRHLPQSRDQVISYLQGCPDFDNKPYFIFRVLYFLKQWDIPGAFSLFEQYQQQGYKDTFQFYQILQDVAPYNMDWVINIYQPFLMREIKGESSLKQQSRHSYQEEKLFEKLFELDPVKAFWFAWEILDHLIGGMSTLNNLNQLMKGDYHFMMYDYDRSETERGTYSELFTQMIEALTKFISTNRDEFSKVYERIKASDKMAFFRMLTYALNNQTEDLSGIKDYVYHFFCLANDKNCLATDEKFEYHIRKTLGKYFPYFNKEQQLHIAQLILELKDPFELGKHNYSGKKDFFRNYGLTKYRYLKALPQNFLLENEKTRKVYQELERRWKQSKEVEPFKVRTYVVGPPLNQKAYDNMDFDQWLNSFKVYNTDENRNHEHPEKGGLVENYRAFKAQVEKRPDHFLPFVERLFSENIHPAYIIAGLDGLKAGKIPVRDFYRLYKTAIQKEYETSEMMQLIWMADYLVKEDVMDEEILDFLIDQALHHSNPAEDKGQPTHEAINTVRGAAVEKLTMIDFNPSWSEKIFTTLRQVAEDPQISVRVSLVLRLAYMMNLDQEKTVEVFTKVTQTYQPDIYKASVWSAQYLANYAFTKMQVYFNNFLQNPDGSEDIATIAAVAYLNNRPGSADLIEQLFNTTDAVRTKIIHVGSVNILQEREDICERSKALFLMGKHLDSEAITHEYSIAFLKWMPQHFEKLFPVIYVYSRSKAGKKQLHYYYEYLLKCVKQHPEKCLRLISNIREHYQPEAGQRMAIEEPIKIAIGIFNALSKLPGKHKECRKALLLFDYLLSDPYYRRNASNVTEQVEI